MAKQKPALGRGLGGLIAGGAAPRPDTANPALAARPRDEAIPEGLVPLPKKSAKPASAALMEVPLDLIEPNPRQPRRVFEEESLEELAASIRAEGLLQPVVVRELSNGRFQLIAGERRWKACQAIGMTRILARIVEATEASSAVLSLVENLQRADLNPLEEAMGYASLMRDFDLTQEAVAERVGKGRASVANSLRLLNLEAEPQGYLARGLLSVGHAKVLLSLDAGEPRVLLARRIVEQGLSVRETEAAVEKLRQQRPGRATQRAHPTQDARAVAAYERQVGTYLGTPVHIRHHPKKGRLVIEYFGNDDLQRILEKMGMPST